MTPELLRTIPRPVRLTAAGVAVALIAGALAAGALASGVWLYVVATRDAARHKTLESNGVSTQAEVVELRRTGGEHPQRIVIYRYEVDGKAYRGRTTIRGSFRPGSPIAVHYLPSEPGRSWAPGHAPQGVPLWTVPLAPLSLGLGAALIVYGLRRQRRLLEGGRPAVATVTRSQRVRHGETSANRVYFEFTVLSGATRTSHFDMSRKPPAAGSTLTILYDPDNPRRTARYPLSFVRTP